MCELCSQDQEVKESAIRRHRDIASRLTRMANHYRGLADGTILPHMPSGNQMSLDARYMIRELAREWI